MICWSSVVAQDKFSTILDQSTQSISSNFTDTSSSEYFAPRGSGIQAFVYDVVDRFVFPLLLIGSVLVVIVGLYDLMLSGKEEIEKWTKYIGYGALGIVVIQSAKFITSTYTGIIQSVVPSNSSNWSITFAQLAYEIYKQLLMPFIDIFMYIVIGVLFLILMVHVMRFVTSSDEDIAQKARSIVISNVIGIVVILLAKVMVESIYGKQSEIIANGTPADLGWIGSGVLGGADLTLVFGIVNYMLGFLGLVILILIIVQTYQLLFKPTDQDILKKIKSNLVYIVIGLGIIALAYVIVNFVLI